MHGQSCAPSATWLVNVRSFSDCYVLNVGGSQYVRVVTSPLPTENK